MATRRAFGNSLRGINLANKYLMSKLTNKGLLARNTSLNMIGRGAPLIVAVICLPLLVKDMGIERFGVLSLAWMVIGYFGLFDFGLGSAVTKFVAERIEVQDEHEIAAIFWTSFFIMSFLGLIGGITIVVLSPWLVYELLKVPETLQPESCAAFRVLGASVPFIVSASALRGFLEGHQRFGFINTIRVGLGVATYLAPVLVFSFSKSLVAVVIALLLFRILAWIVNLFFCFFVIPVTRGGIKIHRLWLKPLLTFGGWITINNVIDPFLVYLDRFLIGAMVSMSAVTYYVTPFEVITKILIIPSSIASVLFPSFAAVYRNNSERMSSLYFSGIEAIFFIQFPISLILIVLAKIILAAWLGKAISDNSFQVMQWLTLGVFFNGLSHVPSTLLLSTGRPDLTVKLHLIELPIYIGGLLWLANIAGIQGVAIAWMLRAFVDMICLFMLAHLIPSVALPSKRWMGMVMGVAIIMLLLAMVPKTGWTEFTYIVLALSFFFFSLGVAFLWSDGKLIFCSSVKKKA